MGVMGHSLLPFTFYLLPFFKVLIVLQRAPVASPAEATLFEEAIAEVGVVYLARYVLAMVSVAGIGGTLGRSDLTATQIEAGIVERVDVHGHTEAVVRERLTACHTPVAEAGCIVVGHRTPVIGIVFVYQTHTGYGIAGLVETAEDVEQVIGNEAVAHHFALLDLTLEIVMGKAEIAQGMPVDVVPLGTGTTLHQAPDAVGYCRGLEDLRPGGAYKAE